MNELTISLDPHRKTPLYEQIYGFIREEIRGGRIRAGERLPSARALSGYLSVRDRKSTRLNSSHNRESRMPSSA